MREKTIYREKILTEKESYRCIECDSEREIIIINKNIKFNSACFCIFWILRHIRHIVFFGVISAYYFM